MFSKAMSVFGSTELTVHGWWVSRAVLSAELRKMHGNQGYAVRESARQLFKYLCDWDPSAGVPKSTHNDYAVRKTLHEFVLLSTNRCLENANIDDLSLWDAYLVLTRHQFENWVSYHGKTNAWFEDAKGEPIEVWRQAWINSELDKIRIWRCLLYTSDAADE